MGIAVGNPSKVNGRLSVAKPKRQDTSGFQRQSDGSALVNGKKYPKGTQEDDPRLPKMSPTSGGLKVKKASGKVSADEPSSIQGGQFNPGSDALQDRKPVNFKKSPQPNNNEGQSLQGSSSTPQVGNSSVNARGGLKGAISSRVFGKKKLKVAR